MERRAKVIVNYAVAKAMQAGLISQNNTDWFKWSFTKGGVISVDNGKESDIDQTNFKLGITTLSEIASKKGLDWYELREQQQKETEDLLGRALEISKKFNISVDSAIALLSQRTPNQAPITDTSVASNVPVVEGTTPAEGND